MTPSYYCNLSFRTIVYFLWTKKVWWKRTAYNLVILRDVWVPMWGSMDKTNDINCMQHDILQYKLRNPKTVIFHKKHRCLSYNDYLHMVYLTCLLSPTIFRENSQAIFNKVILSSKMYPSDRHWQIIFHQTSHTANENVSYCSINYEWTHVIFYILVQNEN